VNPGPAVLVVVDGIVKICHRAIVVEKRDSRRRSKTDRA
jgi:hypothetical protein